MVIGFLRVVELVDLHELLQTLPKVEGKEVEPHQAARIQNQLQSVELPEAISQLSSPADYTAAGRNLIRRYYSFTFNWGPTCWLCPLPLCLKSPSLQTRFTSR